MTYNVFMKLALLSLIASIIYSIILLFLPLTNTPSYESSMAINIFILLFFLYLFPKLKRLYPEEEFVSTILSISLTLFLTPLIILIIYGVFNSLCPGLNGFIFYTLLNAPLLFLLSAIGIILYKSKIGTRWGAIIYLLLIIISLTINLLEILYTPKVKFYSLFWGFFPGPIYDEDIQPDLDLYYIKILSFLVSTIIWLTYYKRSHFKVFLSIILVIPSLIISHKIYNTYIFPKKIISTLGSIYNTRHFEIVYPPDQEWSNNIEVIGVLHEYYYQELCSELKIDLDIKIRSYIFRDEDEKKEITGAGRTQIAKPWLKEIYLTPISITDAKLKHEISHIIVGSIIDNPLGLYGKFGGLLPNMAVIEGVSVALEPETSILTLYEKASILLKKGKLPSFENLFNSGRFYAKSGSISYSTSGSFIKYLIQHYGIDRFKSILKNQKFEDVYGKNLSDIEKEYHNFLEGIIISPQKEYYSSVLYNTKGLIEKKCPHEIANVKKNISLFNKRFYSTYAYDKYKAILTYCLADNEIIIEVSKALINLKRYDEAEQLLTQNIGKAENSHYQNLMLDMLSDIYIFKGDIDKGISMIENQILKLPDSDAKRNFEMKLYLYRRGLMELLKRFYTIHRTPLTKAGILTNHNLVKNDIIVNYLFGRLLFNTFDYENSSRYLMEFLNISRNNAEIPKSLILESANMLLVASIYSKDYKIAEDTIEIVDSIPKILFEEYDYHLRRYNHIKRFFYFIKNTTTQSTYNTQDR